MVLASSATSFTIALAAVFFVFFPILVHVLLGIAVVRAYGERIDNQLHTRRWGKSER